MRFTASVIVPLIALVCVGVTEAADPVRGGGALTIAVEVELGEDRGQSLGSLFEVRDVEGRVVAGAGFHDVYNTHFRTNPRMLQVSVRPAEEAGAVIERLPSPELGFGAYLFDVDGELYAWSSLDDGTARRWDEDAGRWVDELPEGVAKIRKGDVVMPVGDGRLTCSEGQARYDGTSILPAAEVGAYSDFYYANGFLCFFHRLRSETDGFTHIYACPWTPGEGTVDLSRAIVLNTMFDFETTFAWGQWGEQVLTVSNVGGVYVLDDGAWRVVLDPDRNTSYQVYSMLRRRDRLLLAQYPTGHIFEYRGESAVEIPGWPPRLEGVSRSARECQSLAVYNGEVFAGVWPWAELWRLDDGDRWHSEGRMFTHPAITDKTVQPYEAEAERMGLVLNHWGERTCAMLPLGDALYVSTSAKGTGAWPENVDFLTDEQRGEYGAVLRLRMPGNLAAPVRWPDGPTRFEFVIGQDRLVIRQDGADLAATELRAGHRIFSESADFHWGDGVSGALRGTIVDTGAEFGRSR